MCRYQELVYLMFEIFSVKFRLNCLNGIQRVIFNSRPGIGEQEITSANRVPKVVF